jgi:phosphatidylinositol glycan class V
LASSIRSNSVVNAGFFVWNLITLSKSKQGFLLNLLKTTFLIVTTIAPFVLFQYYAYSQFCTTDMRPWCFYRIPMIYSFVQSHYWNNGFLTYYRIHQIPNFILASPLLYYHFVCILDYIKHDPVGFFTLGYKRKTSTTIDFYRSRLLPFVYLFTFLYLYNVFFMHIQVMIRFFTSQPVLMWYLASNSTQSTSYLYIRYSIMFATIGAILFGNFLPPA